MYGKFESLTDGNEFIALDNIIFNINQIKNNIAEDFLLKKSNLNFCSKNIFIRKYFREVNNQGIFNRIEWKFRLKKNIRCELITFDRITPLYELQLRVILDFSKKGNYNTEDLELKVLLDFYLRELEGEKTPTIDDIETIPLKNLYEQNILYFYSFDSEEICI